MEMSFISMDYDVSQRALAAVEESAILRTERKRLLIQARILREARKGARSVGPVLEVSSAISGDMRTSHRSSRRP